MSDPVIGIAVLDREKDGVSGTEILHILCRFRDGVARREALPVYPKGSAKPATCAWEYEIRGEIIHVCPSVKISTTRPSKTNRDVNEDVELFHNDREWSIPFKEFLHLPEGDPMFYVQASDLFRNINGLEQRVE